YMDTDAYGGIIYNTEDYMELADACNKVLLPSDEFTDIELEDVSEGRNPNGLQYHTYSYTCRDSGGREWSSGLTLFDTKGEYGCYSIYQRVLGSADDADDLWKKGSDCIESFKITGEYDSGNYTIYDSDECGIRFAMNVPCTIEENDGDVIKIICQPKDGEDDNLFFIPGELYGSDYSEMVKSISQVLQGYENGQETTLEASLGTDFYPINFGRYPGYLINLTYTREGNDHNALYMCISADDASSKYKTYIALGDVADIDKLNSMVASFRFDGAAAHDLSGVDVSETVPVSD
nr:hypothetical protein [Lachnospiraceae bacterium]